MLTIDLASVQANWRQISSLSVGAVSAGVIKANAYGLGVSQVGLSLYDVGCRDFFVANLSEGLHARSFLPSDARIFVLGGARSGEEAEFINRNLIPVLSSLFAVKNWARCNSGSNSPAVSAIKINTGMTRLGLDIEEFRTLVLDFTFLAAVNPILFMSHLACADEPSHPLNHSQLDVFLSCTSWVRKALPNAKFSLANSSGVFLGESWHFDLVRPGAALYGINPTPDKINPMASVMKLSLPIIQVRTLVDDSVLGYGAEGNLSKGKRVVVVAGGYADGLHRTVGRAPEGNLGGHHVRSIGRMSMDVTMFDASNVPFTDEQLMLSSIDVVDDYFSLDYLTKQHNLLGYEILTSLGHRYKRNYLRGTINA